MRAIALPYRQAEESGVMDEQIKIAVIGAGAIGGISAAYMAKAGLDVELACKHGETADAANGEGLLVSGVRGERRTRVKAVKEIEELHGMKDIVMIAVKAYDLPDAARSALPFLKPFSLVVSMQNGICTDALAEIVGRERAVGCVIGWGATMLDRTTLELTSEGEFVIGGLETGVTARLGQLKQVYESFMPARISGNIVSELYSKMAVNACITSLGAICGLTLGKMLKKKTARDLFLAIISEAVAVADGMGMKIPPYAGKLDYYSLSGGKGLFALLKKHIIISVVGFKYRRLKSSSLQSLERGKPTEIDYFNGYIAKKGAALGISTPVNDAVVKMVKEIEAGKRKPDPANFSEIPY
jgi:2-dehydropantoate 2-reductase